METLQQIITLAGSIFAIIITAITFIIPLIKNVKAKKALQVALSVTKKLEQLTKMVQPIMRETEKFKEFSPEAKKQYALTKLHAFAIENNIPFDENMISNEIETIVETTRKINQRDKDKISEQEKKEVIL